MRKFSTNSTRLKFTFALISVLISVSLSTVLFAAKDIPYAPTQADQLPDAVLGKASAPQGEALAYFDENPRAVGYLARPASKQIRGSVILIHEWNGLGQRVKQVADAFAAEGYLALAADLYSGRTGSNRDENMKLVMETLGKPVCGSTAQGRHR